MTPSDLFRERWRARDNRVLISVHRGLWGPLPENSRAAIEAGHSFGIVEIDVQLSKDGIPVLMHDPDLQRMTGNTGKVAMLSAAELSAHHLREGDGGPDARITQETLPALADVLADVPDRAFFDFDVKEDREVEAVAAAIQNLGHAHTGSIKIDVNTPEDAKRRAALEERYGIMVMAKVMLPDAAPNVIETLVQSGAAFAKIYFDDFDQLGKAAKAAGGWLALGTYTMDPVHCCGLSDARALHDPDAVWGRLADGGITVLMTDHARALAAWRDR